MRERLYTLRMSTEETARAERLAAYYGLPVSAVLRMLLIERERMLERQGKLPPKDDPPK